MEERLRNARKAFIEETGHEPTPEESSSIQRAVFAFEFQKFAEDQQKNRQAMYREQQLNRVDLEDRQMQARKDMEDRQMQEATRNDMAAMQGLMSIFGLPSDVLAPARANQQGSSSRLRSWSPRIFLCTMPTLFQKKKSRRPTIW